MLIKDENYVCIQGWMLNKLDLKGNDLLVYAIIYGFTQSVSCAYVGSLQYLADWCNSTKQGVLKNLNNLIENGYIERDAWYENNIKHVEYWAVDLEKVLNKVDRGIKQSLMGYSTEFNGGIKQSLTNNINNKQEDNKDDNDIVEKFITAYNDICKSMSTIRKLTDKRKNAIKRLYKNYSEEDILLVLHKVEASDFLVNRNKDNRNGWKATIDWILNDNNFIKILEGNYDNRGGNNKSKFAETSKISSKKVTEEEIANGYFTDEVY